MTKYSKLFSFTLLSIITLLAMVLYLFQSQGPTLSLEVVTDEGNDDELLVTNFTGYAFKRDMTSQAPAFEFDAGEFIFRNERPLIQRVDYQYNPGMNRYVREYRSFMRGKSRQLNVFTETDEFIYYTAMPSDVNWQASDDNHVSISRFNKETEEETSFEALLTGGSYHTIVAAYVDYPSLTLVTRSSSGVFEDNWLIYSFDFNQPEEELDPVANITRLIDSNTVQIGSSKIKTERYIPFRSLIAGEKDEYDYVTEYDPHAYYIYDTQSNELKEVPSFDDGDLIVLSESDRIITGNSLEEEVVWYEWDFNSETLHELGTTSMINSTIGRTFDDYYYQSFNQNVHLVDGKIYSTEDSYTAEAEGLSLFQIVSLDTLETVFSGHLDLGDNENGQAEIIIDEISFNPSID